MKAPSNLLFFDKVGFAQPSFKVTWTSTSLHFVIVASETTGQFQILDASKHLRSCFEAPAIPENVASSFCLCSSSNLLYRFSFTSSNPTANTLNVFSLASATPQQTLSIPLPIPSPIVKSIVIQEATYESDSEPPRVITARMLALTQDGHVHSIPLPIAEGNSISSLSFSLPSPASPSSQSLHHLTAGAPGVAIAIHSGSHAMIIDLLSFSILRLFPTDAAIAACAVDSDRSFFSLCNPSEEESELDSYPSYGPILIEGSRIVDPKQNQMVRLRFENSACASLGPHAPFTINGDHMYLMGSNNLICLDISAAGPIGKGKNSAARVVWMKELALTPLFDTLPPSVASDSESLKNNYMSFTLHVLSEGTRLLVIGTMDLKQFNEQDEDEDEEPILQTRMAIFEAKTGKYIDTSGAVVTADIAAAAPAAGIASSSKGKQPALVDEDAEEFEGYNDWDDEGDEEEEDEDDDEPQDEERRKADSAELDHEVVLSSEEEQEHKAGAQAHHHLLDNGKLVVYYKGYVHLWGTDNLRKQ